MTFGTIILNARKKKGLSLRECAAKIIKEDGTPLSFQYLSEIENGTRHPPSEVIMKQLAAALEMPVEVLYFYSRTIPSNLHPQPIEDDIVTAYQFLISKLASNSA